jgi:hypothetical protein
MNAAWLNEGVMTEILTVAPVHRRSAPAANVAPGLDGTARSMK